MATIATPPTATIHDTIMWDINRDCFAFGYIVKVTDKAIQIDYHLQPVWSNGRSIYDRTAWIPKSILIQKEDNTLTIPPWFAKKIEPKRIKPYFLGEDNNDKKYC